MDQSLRGADHYWNFGDGNYFTLQETKHPYEQYKTYEVGLRLLGGEG